MAGDAQDVDEDQAIVGLVGLVAFGFARIIVGLAESGEAVT
jgi:hypothetical protein